jgi:hypothetical protein
MLTNSGRLKCDRNVPCSNCIARKASCVFAPQARHQNRVLGMRTEAKHQVDARLRRLEQLVNSMTSPVSQTSPVNVTEYDEQPGAALSDVQKPSVAIESGRIVTNSQQTVYVSGAHWASICYEVSRARRRLGRNFSTNSNILAFYRSPTSASILTMQTQQSLQPFWKPVALMVPCYSMDMRCRLIWIVSCPISLRRISRTNWSLDTSTAPNFHQVRLSRYHI